MQLGLEFIAHQQDHTGNGPQAQRKLLLSCPVEKLSHSQFNPRLNRDNAQIKKLAKRMQRNGYEITRALWVYKKDGQYKVFAGGTRLEAARLIELPEVPIILHSGFSEDQIVKLSCQDNENDEYHQPLNCVEVWASYKKLAEMGWTQERIAKAKGVSQKMVSFRLNCANLPDSITQYFSTKDFLNEGQAREFLKLEHCTNLSSWLDRETAMQEIMARVLKLKISHITAKVFAKEVEKYNGYISKAKEFFDKTPDNAKSRFIDYLGKARSQNQIERAYLKLIKDLEKEEEEKRQKLREEEESVIAEQERIAEEKRIQEEKARLLSKLVLGDFKPAMAGLEDGSVSLIFTDPPYHSDNLHVYCELAEIAAKKLKPGGSLLAYTGHYALDSVLDAMNKHLRYWWLISLVHGGKRKKLEGKRVVVGWKPIVWFVKDTFKSESYINDTFLSQQPEKDLHEYQQDLSEAQYYIEALTEEGDLVVDPFLGSGTTIIAAYKFSRDFWGCERDKEVMSTAQDRLLAEYEDRTKAND